MTLPGPEDCRRDHPRRPGADRSTSTPGVQVMIGSGGWSEWAEARLHADAVGCGWGVDDLSRAARVDWLHEGRWAYLRMLHAEASTPIELAGLAAGDVASVRCDERFGTTLLSTSRSAATGQATCPRTTRPRRSRSRRRCWFDLRADVAAGMRRTLHPPPCAGVGHPNGPGSPDRSCISREEERVHRRGPVPEAVMDSARDRVIVRIGKGHPITFLISVA